MRLLTPRSPEIEGPFAGTYRAYRPSSMTGRVMEIVIICILGFCAYKLYRFVTVRMGLEAVRAYMYLNMLNEGVTPEEANLTVWRAVLEPHSPFMQHVTAMAHLEYSTVHDGKQLPMIGHAYRMGLRSSMPTWYRKGALATAKTLAIEVSYGKILQMSSAKTVSQEAELHSTLDAYEEYRTQFLSILKTYFVDTADVERCVNALPDNRIRVAYQAGTPTNVIASQYRDMLAETLLSTEVRR